MGEVFVCSEIETFGSFGTVKANCKDLSLYDSYSANIMLLLAKSLFVCLITYNWTTSASAFYNFI